MTDVRIATPTKAPAHPPTAHPASTLPSPAPDSPEEALSWLGGTVEEVAEALRARGIKGRQKEANDCPLARYLCQWWEEASVWKIYTVIGTERPTINKPTPEACFKFAYAFDHDEFPDLIAD